MLDSFYKLQDSKFNIVYKVLFHKYDPLTDKNIYIAHITNYDILKITNVSHCLDAQDKCIEILLKEVRNINKNNSVIYTFYDLKKGIRFLPDIRVFSRGESKKAEHENKENLHLGGMVLIVPDSFIKKYKNALIKISKFFNSSTNIDVVGDYEEALSAIEQFKI